MKEKKGLMVLGIGGLLGALLLIFRKGKPALPEPPPNGVVVGLWNPPIETNRFGLTLYDWPGEKSLGVTVDSIDGIATFDIPPDWAFPLRFWISVVYYPDGSMIILHQAQSFSPDWPYYVAQFIPDYGGYYYNVAKERFEKA